MDDGKGLPAMNGTRKGCGLGNMNQRARQIGAELNICNRLNEPGVMVELIINQSNQWQHSSRQQYHSYSNYIISFWASMY